MKVKLQFIMREFHIRTWNNPYFTYEK